MAAAVGARPARAPHHHRHARREYTHPPRVVTQPKTPPLLNAQLSAAEKNWRGEAAVVVRPRAPRRRAPRRPTHLPTLTTFSNGYLGSRDDEERSEMRYVMRTAERESSSL